MGFGGHGELVSAPEALLPAARRALDSNLPAVLNVLIEGLPAPTLGR
jgi:acetolactate synthase-1/2/3 large subunit